MTSQEVAEKLGVTIACATSWARKNGVKGVQLPNILRMAYDWTEEDIERFKQRRGKGKPRKEIINPNKIKRTKISADDVLNLLK